MCVPLHRPVPVKFTRRLPETVHSVASPTVSDALGAAGLRHAFLNRGYGSYARRSQRGIRSDVVVVADRRFGVLFWAFVCFAISGCSFTEDRMLAVRPEQFACTVSSDCAFAHLGCNSCGSYVAKEHAAILSAQQRDLCRRYRGPIVDCRPLEDAVCRDGFCVTELAQWPCRPAAPDCLTSPSAH